MRQQLKCNLALLLPLQNPQSVCTRGSQQSPTVAEAVALARPHKPDLANFQI